jgi:membrane-associated protease RseP (regulator of RpoE activity)
MQVYDVTPGDPRAGFAARFRGRLMIDSAEAYRQLEPAFTMEETTLLFRKQGPDHVVLAVPGRIRPGPSNPWINLLLFGATLVSVLIAGVSTQDAVGADTGSVGGFLSGLLRALPSGLPFAGSLLAILLAHEFGHYLAARRHHTAVSLPYFIPFPFSLFGTMGAFIRLKQPPRDRRVLLDIGLAGPLAGLVVAVPVLLIGLSLSTVERLPSTPALAGAGSIIEGNSILYLLAKFLTKGQLLPAPAGYGGISPVLYWLRYFLIGRPIPYGAFDVMLSPVAWAGWAGILVTALNLIPAGQLDGGHVLYVLLGERASRILPFIIVGLMALGLAWSGWWLWAALVFFLGRAHAQPLDEITPLDPRRKALAIFGLVVFFLVFTPVPLQALGPAF